MSPTTPTENDSTPPLPLVQSLLLQTKTWTNLPWYMTLIGCTIAFRVSLLPLAVIQHRNIVRLAQPIVQAQSQHLVMLFRKHVHEHPTEKLRAAGLYAAGTSAIWHKHGVSMAKMIALPLLNMSMFLTYVFATRDLIATDRAQQWGMNNEGALWFIDLTTMDQTMLLPIMAITSSWIGLELGFGGGGRLRPTLNQPTTFISTIKFILQSTLVLSTPLVTQLPAGVFMYWIPSSMFGIAQTTTMRAWIRQRMHAVQKTTMKKM